MVLNVENNMCALLIPAGNGNACAQMSQDRQRGEENCKIERLWGINLSTVQQRENFASFIRPKQRWQKFAYRLPWHWNLTSGKICHIEIYNERSIFQFNCFSHLNRCRLIIWKQNHLKLTSITAMFKRKFHTCRQSMFIPLAKRPARPDNHDLCQNIRLSCTFKTTDCRTFPR